MNTNLTVIESIIDDIRETELFSDFLTMHEAILADNELLDIIEQYRAAREVFASLRLDGVKGQALDEAKANVRAQQLIFEEQQMLKEYFRKERFVELFLDDLQYEFNNLLSLAKSSCS